MPKVGIENRNGHGLAHPIGLPPNHPVEKGAIFHDPLGGTPMTMETPNDQPRGRVFNLEQPGLGNTSMQYLEE